MKQKDLLVVMLLALFFCMGIIGCDFDNENGDSHEIKTCEVSAHKVMKEVVLVDEKVVLPHFELTYETGRKEYIVDSELKGFDEYEEGFKYKLKIKITHFAKPPLDWYGVGYLVLETLSKIKDTEAITLQSGAIVKKRGNKYIYLEDIVLSREQLELLDKTGSIFGSMTLEGAESLKDEGIPVYPLVGMTAYSKEEQTKAVGVAPQQNRFWSMLRYTYSPKLTSYQKRQIKDAIDYMESVTNVRFYNATGEPTKHPKYGFDYPYVEFVSSGVNQSNIGRIGGKQLIEIYNFGIRGTIVHEICHALGMFHEQSRADRDKYVTVHYNNMPDSAKNNFHKETKNYYMLNGFDFNSVMLYSSYAFSKTGKPTMTKKDGTTFTGQRNGLSEKDRMFLNRFYLPFKARKDVCAELDDVVYDANNKPLSEAQRIDLERRLNRNRCSYPLEN